MEPKFLNLQYEGSTGEVVVLGCAHAAASAVSVSRRRVVFSRLKDGAHMQWRVRRQRSAVAKNKLLDAVYGDAHCATREAALCSHHLVNEDGPVMRLHRALPQRVCVGSVQRAVHFEGATKVLLAAP